MINRKFHYFWDIHNKLWTYYKMGQSESIAQIVADARHTR